MKTKLILSLVELLNHYAKDKWKIDYPSIFKETEVIRKEVEENRNYHMGRQIDRRENWMNEG